ncbi:hypothetical protein [Mycetocola sp. 2940]|uniref:hypothetical protein n=1 Tax=Mycetocola sp. 2940 TaxID=3156452 RepID=UPI003396C6B4
MKTWFRGAHLRQAAKGLGELVGERPEVRGVKVYAERESRVGYALVEFVRLTPKGKLKMLKFALHWDDDGRRLLLVKASAYGTGPTIEKRSIPGDMVHPWLTAATSMLEGLSEKKAKRSG